jgi:hypothetical protein
MKRAALARRKAVVCLNDKKEFLSACEAARHYNLGKGSVNYVCNKKRKQVRGLSFMWKNAA